MTSKRILKLQNLRKNFDGLTVFNNLNLNIFYGELVGVIGPNGAGKTTLFNIISGLHNPDQGQVILSERDITKLPPYKRCRLGIGRTSQIPMPFKNLTVLENVAIGVLFGRLDPLITMRDAKEQARLLVDNVRLTTNINELAKNLTLGQQKKMDLARALSTNPKILLLDEVVAGLDNAEIVDILDIIRGIHERGVSILMIEHNVKTIINMSDRVIVLYDGGIIANGNPQEIIYDRNVLKAYIGTNKRF